MLPQTLEMTNTSATGEDRTKLKPDISIRRVPADESDSEDEWRIDVTEADLQHAKDMMPENVRRHP